MTLEYRVGVIITFAREDGQPGPGETRQYRASEGWSVEIRDEGCVRIKGYGRTPIPPDIVVPWHRIWEITDIVVPRPDQRHASAMTSALAVGANTVAETRPLGSPRICAEQSCDLAGQPTEKLRCSACGKFTQLT
jgi:hypothetical protein